MLYSQDAYYYRRDVGSSFKWQRATKIPLRELILFLKYQKIPAIPKLYIFI